MFSILDEATIGTAMATREEEVRLLLTEREVKRQKRNHPATAWNWRVEPGKEEEFEHLRGWLLSGLEDGAVDVATASRDARVRLADPTPGMASGTSLARCRRSSVASRRQLRLVRTGACLAGRAFMGAGRHLIEWSGEPQ